MVDIVPNCRYGHGNLQVVEIDDMPAHFFAPLASARDVRLGLGYVFLIYKCPTCSYLELHDDGSQGDDGAAENAGD